MVVAGQIWPSNPPCLVLGLFQNTHSLALHFRPENIIENPSINPSIHVTFLIFMIMEDQINAEFSGYQTTCDFKKRNVQIYEAKHFRVKYFTRISTTFVPIAIQCT